MGRDPDSLPFPGLHWPISHFSASPSSPSNSQGGRFRHHPRLPRSDSASSLLRKLLQHSASSPSSSSSSLSLQPPRPSLGPQGKYLPSAVLVHSWGWLQAPWEA